MRLGGATGAPPASRSRNHDRSQPAPTPPMLAQRGFRGRLLPTLISIRCAPAGAMSATPPVAEWTTTTTTTTAPRRTTAAGPAILLCFATGDGGACGSRSVIQPAHRCRDHDTPSQFQPALTFDRALASRRRTRHHNSDVRGSASAPGPLNPGLSRWLLPLVPHRTRHRFATTSAGSDTNASRTTNAPEPLRSGAFTMQ